jgi:hypothetical protein
MRARLLVAFVLILSAGAAESAPAPTRPTRRPAPRCEVVIDAGTHDRAFIAAEAVPLDAFLNDVLSRAVVSQHLAFLETQAARRAWLKKRLTVTREDVTVRVRLDGPLPILEALTGELTRDGGQEAIRKREEWIRRAAAMAKLRCMGPGYVTDKEYYDAIRTQHWYRLQADPPMVLRAPRVVR